MGGGFFGVVFQPKVIVFGPDSRYHDLTNMFLQPFWYIETPFENNMDHSN